MNASPVLAAALLVAACAGGTAGDGVPTTDLARVAPAVAKRLEAAVASVRSAPADPGGWLALGMLYEANDFLGLAAASYEGAVECGSDPRALYRLGIVRARQADPAGAAEALERCVALAGDYAPAWWRLGSALLDLGRLDAAERSFARARELDPQHLGGWNGLAQVQLVRGEAEEAIATLSQALQRRPRAPSVRKLLRSAYFEAGRVEEARAMHVPWERPGQLGNDPWQRELLALRERPPMERAHEHLTSGEFAAAATLLEEFTRANPDDPNAWAYLASAQLAQGEVDAARATLARALARRPDSIMLLRVQARLHASAGATDEALGVLARIVAIDPLDLDAWREKGELEGRLERHVEALASLERVARLDERDPDLLVAIGGHQLALERWDAARASFERARRLDGGPPALAGLVRALEGAGRPDEARRVLAEARAEEDGR